MDDTAQLPGTRPGDEERAQTIAQRMAREKALLIDQLRKVPIVQSACEKVKVSRATFYNWKKDDADFAKQVDEAIGDGTLFMNDMAESQLLTAIREGNLGAITYWLKHRHAAYSNRMEVTAKIKQEDALTQEQERAIEEALRLTAVGEPPSVSLSISPASHDTDSATSDTSADSVEHTATDHGTCSPTQAGI
jgi:ACT domain-containing protein